VRGATLGRTVGAVECDGYRPQLQGRGFVAGEDFAEVEVGDPLVGEFVPGFDLDDFFEGSTRFFVSLLGDELGAESEPGIEDVFAVICDDLAEEIFCLGGFAALESHAGGVEEIFVVARIKLVGVAVEFFRFFEEAAGAGEVAPLGGETGEGFFICFDGFEDALGFREVSEFDEVRGVEDEEAGVFIVLREDGFVEEAGAGELVVFFCFVEQVEEFV
jgi:hypothetical protein